jgi:putative nucleotide binding protein
MKPRYRKKLEILDEFAIVLDYMPMGNPYDKHSFHRSSPIAQGIGTKFFTLVEIIPLKGSMMVIGERIPLSLTPDMPGHRVFDRLLYEDLTSIARENIVKYVRQVVEEKERVFVEFLNIAEAINIRLHSLELLPGIGKKTLTLILEERRKKMFESFDDVRKRLKINDPVKMFVDRIIIELQRNEKYYLFVCPYPMSPDMKYLRYLELLYERVRYSEPW